jgi:hypothetical protein
MPPRFFRLWFASGDLVNSRESSTKDAKKDGENLTQSRKDAKVKTKAGIAAKAQSV